MGWESTDRNYFDSWVDLWDTRVDRVAYVFSLHFWGPWPRLERGREGGVGGWGAGM